MSLLRKTSTGNPSGLLSQQNQPPLRTTSVVPLPPPPRPPVDATARPSDDDASPPRRGASGCADSAPSFSAPEPEHDDDDEGGREEEDKLWQLQFNEIYAHLLKKTRDKMNEFQMTGDKRYENLAKKFIACRLEQFKKKSCTHQCTGNHQCDCSIGSGSGSVNMDLDESGGSPNNLPQDYNESFEEEGTESKGVEVEGVEAEGVEAEEDSPSGPSSNGEQEETSDDDEHIEGEGKWDLKEVIDMKGLRKKKPIRCQEEDCISAACSAWVSTDNPYDVWYGCIDCMQEYYEGWPSSDEMPVKYLTEEHRALLAEKCSMQESPPMPDLPTTEGDILADFVFIEEEDADVGDTDEHCVYDADYCQRYKITSEWDIDWINLCHEEDMYSEANDTPDNWNRLHRIVEERRGKVVTKKYTFMSTNPLRMRWLQCKHYRSTIRSECTPHPPFNPQRDIERTILYGDVTVKEALPLIQQVAKETFLETGVYEAVLPRTNGRLCKSVKMFLEKGGELAKTANAICNLKQRKGNGSYIAHLTLKYFEQKAGLCLDNQAAFDKYRGERGIDDGEVNWYFGILFRCAGIPLLPHMVKYDVVGEAERNAAEILADPTNMALHTLLGFQAGVTSSLSEKIYWIDRYRLHPDNNPSDCLIYKFFKSIWDGDCQLCIDSEVPCGHHRRSVSLSHLQHVDEEGRLSKQEMAGGKNPTDCSFEVLLSMDEYMVLRCGEHHMLEDCSQLARLASGEIDNYEEGRRKWNRGWREVYKARVTYLTMHLVSRGKSQLNPDDREWILSEGATMDRHHLTMHLNFIDEFGTEWETRKSPDLEGTSLLKLIRDLPDGEWEEFLVRELVICAITGRSDHALLHLVYGPNKVRGLSEYLGIVLPWDETDTHIIMPQAERREIVIDNSNTELSDGEVEAMIQRASDIILDDEEKEETEEEDPEYARLSRVLNTLPMERLIARPCLGDDGGLAPQLLELWGRNTAPRRVTTQVGETPSTQLPFRMRSGSRRAELTDSSEEEVERSYAGLSLGPRIGDDDQNDMNSDHMEEGQQLVQGLQSSDSEELPMRGITLHTDSDSVSELEEQLVEEQQQLDHGYEQRDDADGDRMEEEQQSVGEELSSIHEITLHGNSDCQSMELDESIEAEEQQQQQQLEQNDDETGGQLDDEQRLKQERLEDKQQLERERKLGRRRMIVIETHEKDVRAVGGIPNGPKGRRRKGSATSRFLQRERRQSTD